MTTPCCQSGAMPSPADTLRRVKEVRREALDHARLARELARERRALLEQLIEDGYSQAELGRELGVSRQAIQKMLAGWR